MKFLFLIQNRFHLVARRSPAQQLVAAKAGEASGGGGIDFGLLAAFAGW